VGTTTVTWTGTDLSGKNATCTQEVTVNDNEYPILYLNGVLLPAAPALPPTIEAEATSSQGAQVLFAVTVTDNCGSITTDCTPVSGTLFPLGTTRVDCSATDESGNLQSGRFDVIVKDTTAPTLLCTNIVKPADSAEGAVVSFDVTTTDAADMQIPVICDPPSGSLFPIGTSTVNCQGTDDSLNTGTCSFSVTVQEQTPSQRGRMTGGGSVFTSAGTRVTHGFELHCDASSGPNHLQINWGDGQRFTLEQPTSASCTDAANIAASPPSAGFDTYRGAGIGRYNGIAGARVEWTFTDAGEPGNNDTATLDIWDSFNQHVLTASGKLNRGNHQAHDE
jgi:hypothetical protein